MFHQFFATMIGYPYRIEGKCVYIENSTFNNRALFFEGDHIDLYCDDNQIADEIENLFEMFKNSNSDSNSDMGM